MAFPNPAFSLITEWKIIAGNINKLEHTYLLFGPLCTVFLNMHGSNERHRFGSRECCGFPFRWYEVRSVTPPRSLSGLHVPLLLLRAALHWMVVHGASPSRQSWWCCTESSPLVASLLAFWLKSATAIGRTASFCLRSFLFGGLPKGETRRKVFQSLQHVVPHYRALSLSLAPRFFGGT